MARAQHSQQNPPPPLSDPLPLPCALPPQRSAGAACDTACSASACVRGGRSLRRLGRRIRGAGGAPRGRCGWSGTSASSPSPPRPRSLRPRRRRLAGRSRAQRMCDSQQWRQDLPAAGCRRSAFRRADSVGDTLSDRSRPRHGGHIILPAPCLGRAVSAGCREEAGRRARGGQRRSGAHPSCG